MDKSAELVSHKLTGQHYGYSAADLDDLGASEYTLATIIVDESGSTSPFKAEMEKCIQEVIKSCKFSPRSDYLMVRLVAFNHVMREIHGFKQLVDCSVVDYDDCLSPGGSTLLFATAANAINATNDYGEELADNGYDVNAITFFITDGMDNESEHENPSVSASTVGEALKKASMDEHLESIMTILIGVGVGHYQDVDDYLDNFRQEAGLTQYVPIADASDKTLAKLAAFISKSVSSQSSSLGTGGPSQKLTF